MSQEAGGNPDSAKANGEDAASIAETFDGLVSDFIDLFDLCKTSAGKEPGVTGWSKYEEFASDHLRDVENQALQIAENIQGGAAGLVEVDSESSSEYSEAEQWAIGDINDKTDSYTKE